MSGPARTSRLTSAFLIPRNRGYTKSAQKLPAPAGIFFLNQGRRQIRDIFGQITQRPDLDLYTEAETALKGL